MESKRLIDLHRNKVYSNQANSIDYNRLITQYASLPNEGAYIVDCKTAEVEFLTKEPINQMGIDTSSKHSFEAIIDHVKTDERPNFEKFVYNIVDYYFKNVDTFSPEQNFCVSVYQTPRNRTIIRSTALFLKDSIGQMRYTIGKLTDVTGLIPFRGFRYEFYGPNSNELMSSIGDINEFSEVLTKREIEILLLISKGLASKQIADELFISVETVHTHRKNIIRKLEVSNSLAAYNKAIDLGMV